MEAENKNEGTNSWSMPALLLGIASVFFGTFFIPPILAIVFGSLGISRSTVLINDGIKKTGKGMAIAGLVLGIVYLLLGFYVWAK